MATITKLAMKGAKVNGRMNYNHKNGCFLMDAWLDLMDYLIN